MNLDAFRTLCLSLPHVTEDIKWGDDLLFRVGGKMFAVACLDPAQPHRISFRCTPEEFAELIERDGVVPAPYAARFHWVALEQFDALGAAEIRRLVNESYRLVRATLPRRTRRTLEAASVQPTRQACSRRVRSRPRTRR